MERPSNWPGSLRPRLKNPTVGTGPDEPAYAAQAAYTLSKRAAIRAIRRGISLRRTCSFNVWAPPPSGPKPSSVGHPAAAVIFPSLPPPVSCSPRQNPNSPAVELAISKSRADTSVFSRAPRFIPPESRRAHRESSATSARNSPSTRIPSSILQNLTSILPRAASATTFALVPPAITPTLIVVPAPGSAIFRMRQI